MLGPQSEETRAVTLLWDSPGRVGGADSRFQHECDSGLFVCGIQSLQSQNPHHLLMLLKCNNVLEYGIQKSAS